ncbi:MAG TPA: carboxylesterase, partial [Thalassospira sp.]|nr:carboxylesterase [Thalassospira sp.]
MDGSDQAVPDIAYSPMPDEAGIRDFIARCDRLYP